MAEGSLRGAIPPAPAPSAAPTAEPLNPEQAYAELESFVQEQNEALGIPGAAIALVRDGVRVHAATFGRADDFGRPLTPQTPVLLASAGKTLTAIAVMQQVDLAGCSWMSRCRSTCRGSRWTTAARRPSLVSYELMKPTSSKHSGRDVCQRSCGLSQRPKMQRKGRDLGPFRI